MELDEIIERLDWEWELDEGFLGKLRHGIFEKEGLERLLNILDQLRQKDCSIFEKRLVTLIWDIPLFMGWQIDRVKENGGDVKELKLGINRVYALMEDILGVP